jgi:hypothetical protein
MPEAKRKLIALQPIKTSYNLHLQIGLPFSITFTTSKLVPHHQRIEVHAENTGECHFGPACNSGLSYTLKCEAIFCLPATFVELTIGGRIYGFNRWLETDFTNENS